MKLQLGAVAERLESENLQLFQFEQLPLLRSSALLRGLPLLALAGARCSTNAGWDSRCQALLLGCLSRVAADRRLLASGGGTDCSYCNGQFGRGARRKTL